jgi:hypothetical protein
MKYAKKVILSRQGFCIDSKLLQAIGIRHNSRCRGIFIAKDDEESSKEKIKDLIVSPFPFSSWGCIVKLQIRVSNNVENDLNKILETLAENNFNILYINFTFGGYNHKTFHLIGELWELRPDIIKIRECNKGDDKDKDSLEMSFKYKLYKKMNAIKKLINKEHKDYLHNFKENITEKFKEELKDSNFTYEDFLETDKVQKTQPVDWKWLNVLADYAFKTEKNNETLYFNYDAEKSLLSLVNKEIGRVFLEDFSNSQNYVPVLALSSFDAGNGYIKLRSFNESICNNEILQFDFSYSIYLTKMELNKNNNKDIPKNETVIEGINECGSKRIIKKLLDGIIKSANKRGNIIELTGISTTNLSRPSPTKENGIISVHGIFNSKNKLGWTPNDFKEMKRDIYKGIENIVTPKNQHINSLNIDIRKVLPYTVFISIRENFRERITPNLQDLLKQEGLDSKISGTYTNQVTENVMQDMGLCDTCIQIYSLSKDEIEKVKRDGENADFVPDNSWLLFEFGIARAKGMPVVRMIDVTHLNKKQWIQYLRTDNDKLLMEFDSITKKMFLKNKIREAGRNLLQELEKG